VIKSAARSTAMVSSIFPANIRDRLYQAEEDKKHKQKKNESLKAYLRREGKGRLGGSDSESKPLADLFAETTIMVRTHSSLPCSW
jgi:hypothetical protein